MLRQRCWLLSLTGLFLLVSFLSVLFISHPVRADGTEELGPPQGISIAKGSGLIAAGAGISTTLPTPLNISVPTNSTVRQVLLYWSGGMVGDVLGDDTITISGQDITGRNIGGPTFFFRESGDEVFFSAFRADITNLGLVQPGNNTLSVESQPFPREKDGVGVLVIYDDGSGDARVLIRDGLDLAFWRFPEPRQTVIPQTFTFPAIDQDRTARMSMFFGSVSPTEPRSSVFTITVDSAVAVIANDLLGSNDGAQWDTINVDFLIPAGSTSVTVDALSTPVDDPLGASFSWIASGFFLLEPLPGIELKKFTNGADADNPNGADVPVIASGDPVTWTYRITNTGNISFTEATITVTDSHTSVIPTLVTTSDSPRDSFLAPGESWTYIATGTAEDLTAPGTGVTVVSGCQLGNDAADERETYSNVGRVTVPGNSDSDPSHYCNPPAPAPEPGITLQKHTGGVGVPPADADDANGGDVPLLSAGDAVTWTYFVTNTGAISFTTAQVVVTDSHASVLPQLVVASDDGDGMLAPGESWTYTASGTVADLASPGTGVTTVNGCGGIDAPGQDTAYENIGRVTVPGATASDPSHYCNPTPPEPGIALQKSTNGQGGMPADADDANGADVPLLDVGGAVTWTYIVENTGTVPFAEASVVVTDSHSSVIPVLVASSDAAGDAILSPGESWTYMATGVVANLETPSANITIVNGCAGLGNTGANAYENIGRVTVPGATASDPSHYCNPTPSSLNLVEEPTSLDELNDLQYLPWFVGRSGLVQ